MRKIFTSSFVIALIVGFTTLAGCSSGGSSESGLGLDVSGQWRGKMIESGTGQSAGAISFLFQSDNSPLNPLNSTNHDVRGSFAFENFRPQDCPIGSIVGTIEGTVVGTKLVMDAEGDDWFFTIGGISTNTTMKGDWNMHFEYTIKFIDENDEEQEEDVACNQFGSWSAIKI